MRPLAQGDQPRTDPPQQRPSAQLQFIFRKLFCLASARLNPLTTRLTFVEPARQKAYEIIFELLVAEGKHQLLQGKHLDNLILCSTFCVAQTMSFKFPATNTSMSFLNLVDAYYGEVSIPFPTFITLLKIK